jgi:hypothetical protein
MSSWKVGGNYTLSHWRQGWEKRQRVLHLEGQGGCSWWLLGSDEFICSPQASGGGAKSWRRWWFGPRVHSCSLLKLIWCERKTSVETIKPAGQRHWERCRNKRRRLQSRWNNDNWLSRPETLEQVRVGKVWLCSQTTPPLTLWNWQLEGATLGWGWE